MKRNLILLASLLACSGCGSFEKQSGTSTVRFNLDGPIRAASVDAGVLIYAVNQNFPLDRRAIRITFNGSDGSASMVLPNGRYKFYSVGYDTSGSTALEGSMACGYTPGDADFILDGASTSISLEMNASNCATEFFGGPQDFRLSNTLAQPPAPIAVSSCDSAGFAAATGSANCISNPGALGSMRVLLVPYTMMGGNVNYDFSNALASSCVSLSPAGGMKTTSITLPLGPYNNSGTAAEGARVPFIFVLRGFSDVSCANIHKTYDSFHYGIMTPPGDAKVFNAIGGPSDYVKLFLND